MSNHRFKISEKNMEQVIITLITLKDAEGKVLGTPPTMMDVVEEFLHNKQVAITFEKED